MSAESRVLNFTPGEQRIGRGTSAASMTRHHYVLSTTKLGKCVTFFYSVQEQKPVTGSGPVDIPIYDACCINLKLGSDTLWEFVYDNNQDAVTVGDRKYLSYYGNLNHISKTELEFEARLGPVSSAPADMLHAFNLYIDLYQDSGANPWKIPVKIDPDIINPGNHP